MYNIPVNDVNTKPKSPIFELEGGQLRCSELAQVPIVRAPCIVIHFKYVVSLYSENGRAMQRLRNKNIQETKNAYLQ